MISNKVLALAGLLVIASAVVHTSEKGTKKASLLQSTKSFVCDHYGKIATFLILEDISVGLVIDSKTTTLARSWNLPRWAANHYLVVKPLSKDPRSWLTWIADKVYTYRVI